jgi:hypothetical protein
MSAIVAPERMQAAPQDYWGNVRVPRLEALPQFSQRRSAWLSVPHGTAPEHFSSLFGPP